MFRTLARLYADPTLTGTNPGPFPGDPVFTTHPIQLSRWLEQVFANGGVTQLPPLGLEAVPINAEAVRRLGCRPDCATDRSRSAPARSSPASPPPR